MSVKLTYRPDFFPFPVLTDRTLPATVNKSTDLIGPIPLAKLVEWYWKVKTLIPVGNINVGSASATVTDNPGGSNPNIIIQTFVSFASDSTIPVSTYQEGQASFNSSPAMRTYTNNLGLGITSQTVWNTSPANLGASIYLQGLCAPGTIYKDSNEYYYLVTSLGFSLSAGGYISTAITTTYSQTPEDDNTILYNTNGWGISFINNTNPDEPFVYKRGVITIDGITMPVWYYEAVVCEASDYPTPAIPNPIVYAPLSFSINFIRKDW